MTDREDGDGAEATLRIRRLELDIEDLRFENERLKASMAEKQDEIMTLSDRLGRFAGAARSPAPGRGLGTAAAPQPGPPVRPMDGVAGCRDPAYSPPTRDHPKRVDGVRGLG